MPVPLHSVKHKWWLQLCHVSYECLVIWYQEYGAGRMLTGDVKKRLGEVLTELVERHQRARATVTEEASTFMLDGLLLYWYKLGM